MNSANVYLVVEGQTEQTFVRELLAPELAIKGVFLHPVLIGKPGHKGGDVRFERAMIDIAMLLQQRRDTYVSTMFDFFRIDSNWPGKALLTRRKDAGERLSALQKAEIIESAMLEKVGNKFSAIQGNTRFIPYIEMHEFEALLFSDATLLAQRMGVKNADVNNIMSSFASPEEINEGSKTAPSKRLENMCFTGYRKIVMGISIAKEIGIPVMRQACPHFNGWINQLELLPSFINLKSR